MILIGFLFYRSHGVSGRPGYRIDTVLSRGALEWVTWSHLCGEVKPLHTWHIISWFLFGFYPCENLELVFISMPSSSSSKTDFICISCGVFWYWRFYRFVFYKRGKTLLLWFPPHMMDYDMYTWSCRACDYLRNKLKIIKTESWWISCWVLMIGGFTGCSFIEKVYLSPFGFILPCCTMMFLCIIL